MEISKMNITPDAVARMSQRAHEIWEMEHPGEGNRVTLLREFVFELAKNGLTNDEMGILLDEKFYDWNKDQDKGPWTYWHKLTGMINETRKRYPSNKVNGRYEA